MDCRVRGFTRVRGTKHYIDHKINSIQDYLSKNIKQRYEMFDVNVTVENIFHTKMHVKEFDPDTYLFEEKGQEPVLQGTASASSSSCGAKSKSCSTAAI